MKKSSAICLLSSLVSGATLLPALFTTTSCSEQVLPENIHTHEQSLFAFDHSFELKVVSNGVFPKETKVTLINETRELSIASVSFDNKNAFITMNISEDIHYDTIIKYALSFEYKNKYITVDNLNVFYVYQGEEERKDKIVVVDNIVQRVQERTFDFKFQFSAMPKGPIHPQIVGSSDYLSIPEGTYIVQKDPSTGLLYLDLPIKLADSVDTDRTFSFALTLDFTNSFGDEQSTKVENLSCYFLTDKSLDIPTEYYVIDNAGVLHGFTDLVKNNPQLITAFRRIVIPYNVKSIDADAFNVPFSLSNITEVQFNQQVRSVGNHAFYSLTRLETVDFTLWDGQEATEGIPSWVYSDDNAEIFNLNEVSFRKGFILITNNRSTGIKDLWANHLFKHGLGYKRPQMDTNYSTWSVYHEDEVSPEGWFKIDHTDYGYELTGLNTGEGGITPFNVVNCGLIKIPIFVNSISYNMVHDESFKFFGQYPSKVDGIGQRRICFGPNITNMTSKEYDGLFTKAGLYSCITIPQNMSWIQNYTFYQADRNDNGDVGSKPISFTFYPSYEANYRSVDKFAFSDVEMEYVKIPDGWNPLLAIIPAIGSRIFADSRIMYIDFSELSDFPTEYFGTRSALQGSFSQLVGCDTDHKRYFVIPKNSKRSDSDWMLELDSLGAYHLASGSYWSIIRST